jgi:hypothetical protein
MASRVALGPGAVTFFTRRLRRAGSAGRAAGEKAYLKSDLRFWGTTQDAIRGAVREYSDGHPDLTRADLHTVAETLYATDVHELRAAAIGVLERERETLDHRDLPWLIAIVRRSKSWAYVDWIAPKVIGDVIARDPRARQRLAVWANDTNFWVRRAALLAPSTHCGRAEAISRSGRDSPRRCSTSASSSSARRSAGCCARCRRSDPSLPTRSCESTATVCRGSRCLRARSTCPRRSGGPLDCRPADAKTGRAWGMQPAKPWHGGVGRSGAGTVATSSPRFPDFAPIASRFPPPAGAPGSSRSSRSLVSSGSAPRCSRRRRRGRSPSGPRRIRPRRASLRARQIPRRR